MSLIAELRRRNVFRVGAAYLVFGWLLTEVLTAVLPELGAPEWVSKAVILMFAFGFIPAIVFSWVFELTPDGIKRETEVERDESITTRTAKKLDYITVAGVVVLVIVLGFFGARQSSDETEFLESEISDASVAVLPFVNMSNDQDNEYFSDGLTETLLHMLAQVPDLKVAARTSSFSFKGQDKTIGEIAAALQVAHVLEGSVQRAGDRVRITAQLIRASDGFHVWSESYDRTLDDIFGIQDEIAGKVGGALSASLLGTDSGTMIAGINTASPDAYDLYLQALKESATYSYGGLQAAEDLLKGALTVDPDFLDAKIELADNYLHQVETGLMNQDDAFPEIVAITDQVLEVEPDNGAARAIQIFANTGLHLDSAGPDTIPNAIQELETIVTAEPALLNPKILLMRYYGNVQEPEKAMPLLKSALADDPFNPVIHYELGNLYIALEQWDDARAALKKSLEIEPAQPNAYANLAEISLRSGDGLDYVQQFMRAIEVDPVDHELPGIVAGFLYELELVDEGDDFRNRVIAIAPTSPVAYRTELLRGLASGDEQAGIAAARRALEDGVENRRFAWGGAVQHLLRSAAKNGTVEEEFQYLDEQEPGILDVDNADTPLKYRAAQYAAFDAWYVTDSPEELNARIEKLLVIAQSYGFELKENPEVQVGVLSLQGKTDEAVEIALEKIFTEPVSTNLGWERIYSQAQYNELVADPRVQAAMQRWEAEEAALRDKVRRFLADLQNLQAATG